MVGEVAKTVFQKNGKIKNIAGLRRPIWRIPLYKSIATIFRFQWHSNIKKYNLAAHIGPFQECQFALYRAQINKNDNIMEFLKDMWAYVTQRKKWWLLPLIIILLLIGVLIILGGTSIAPFIYTLF